MPILLPIKPRVRPWIPASPGGAVGRPWIKDHWQGQGLVEWIVSQGGNGSGPGGLGVYDLIYGTLPYHVGSVPSTSARSDPSTGPGTAFNGTSDGVHLPAQAAVRIGPTTTTGLTFACWYRGGPGHPYGGHLYQQAGKTGSTYGGFFFASTSINYGDGTGAGSGDRRSVQSDNYTVELYAEQLNFTAARVWPGTHPYTMHMWHNMRPASSESSSGTGLDVSWATVDRAYGFRALDTDLFYDQTLFELRMYNRLLSDEELYALWSPQQRWDLYQRPMRRLYLDLGAAAAVSISVSEQQGVTDTIQSANW